MNRDAKKEDRSSFPLFRVTRLPQAKSHASSLRIRSLSEICSAGNMDTAVLLALVAAKYFVCSISVLSASEAPVTIETSHRFHRLSQPQHIIVASSNPF